MSFAVKFEIIEWLYSETSSKFSVFYEDYEGDMLFTLIPTMECKNV